jgi:hypothetical protein
MGREEGEAFVEYLQAHELLPRSPVLLGDAEIERLAFMLSSPLADRDAKKRALILLAHCRSPRATAELGRCAATLDASLHRFAALALDESVQSTQALGADPMPLL